MPKKPNKSTHAMKKDVPFTTRLPDGRVLFVLVPGRWCEADVSGEVLFTPEGVRFIDRVQAVAMRTPLAPTPAYIRALRESLGWSQTELAARVGVDKMTVARWEWGKVKPGRAAVKALDKVRTAAARKGVVLAA